MQFAYGFRPRNSASLVQIKFIKFINFPAAKCTKFCFRNRPGMPSRCRRGKRKISEPIAGERFHYSMDCKTSIMELGRD